MKQKAFFERKALNSFQEFYREVEHMIKQAGWIAAPGDYGDVCPVFARSFKLPEKAASATLLISAVGAYEASINGARVGDFILAPGWTAYQSRIQYQEYDVTDMLAGDNALEILVGRGWSGRFTWLRKEMYPMYPSVAVICALRIIFADGSEKAVLSDAGFSVARSNILFSDIYDGEIYDARETAREWEPAAVIDYPKDVLVPQQGEPVREIEVLKPVGLIDTGVDETIVDFGQNLTGYVIINTKQPSGAVLEIRHAEVLRDNENLRFYTENLRGALQRMTYIANGAQTVYKPHFSFQGFRYVRVDKWPAEVCLDDFTAAVVHSDIRRTGYFECSDEKVNKLYQNIIWSQKGNFLDIPTDCPQRDERLGWTGDAQVFARASAYSFDVGKFFAKWLADLALEQYEDGGVPAAIPDPLGRDWANSAAWGDAAVICPWQIYLAYGDKSMLAAQFDSMRKWVDYMRGAADDDYIRRSGSHFGDWLALDNGEGVYSGATPKDLIATAYFAFSTGIFTKAGKILGMDMAPYEELYENVAGAFRREYVRNGKIAAGTQTAHAIALYFGLCGEHRESVAKDLRDMVAANGDRLTTGFVGTPYLLHALSQSGYVETAYSLLLQESFPSWLYSVGKGATTIWEHWDGVREDGGFWDINMNSFNHYSYGAVADWMYGAMCGISPDEDAPGYENAVIKPLPDKRLRYASACIDTKYGKLSSKWSIDGDTVAFDFEVPNKAHITIGQNTYRVGKGTHSFKGVV